MAPFAQPMDVQTAHTNVAPWDGGAAEAGHLLVARLPPRRLFLLCALQGLFSFIRNSLEMHTAMACKSFQKEGINMHGDKSQGQEKI